MKLKIDVLLEEYQACQNNRDHYDSVRWTIGSIFIAISLGIFGISLTEVVINEQYTVMLLSIFSFVWMFIWYLFVLHVHPYVWLSIVRCHEIEEELREMGFDIRLHKSIYNFKQMLKGVHITFALLLVFVAAWLGRMMLLWPNFLCYILILGGFLMLILFVLHFYIYSRTDWGKKIQKILEEGEKTEIRLIEKQIQRFEEEIERIFKQENQESLRKAFEEFRKEIMERIKILRANRD